jgi:hypothetical protein
MKLKNHFITTTDVYIDIGEDVITKLTAPPKITHPVILIFLALILYISIRVWFAPMGYWAELSIEFIYYLIVLYILITEWHHE